MKVIFLSIILLSLGATKAFCQENNSIEVMKIHKIIFNKLKVENANLFVSKKTSKRVYMDFDFKNPPSVDTSSNVIWEQKVWKDFMSEVDTSSIKNYSLETNKNLLPFTAKGNNSEELIFAPVIISKEHNRAICLLQSFRKDSKTGSEIVYLLDKENGQWCVKYVSTFAYFD